MQKILFKLFDYAAALVMGAGTLFVVTLVVGGGWNMFLAMLVGMVLGTVLLVVFAVATAGLTTLFEVIPVGMVVTMIVGMGAGMAVAMTGAGFWSLFWPVVLYSMAAQLMMDVYNAGLKGEVQVADE
jgi:hypothetical protein